MKKPKWVVFDVGGVLLDWRGGLHTAGAMLEVSDSELLDYLKIHLKDLELGGMTEEKFWELATKNFGSSENHYKIAQAWIDGQPSIPSGWQTVERLKCKYRLAICTNNWLGVMENQVNRIEGFDNFEIIIDSSQEKIKKPDKKMYTLVENRLDASGEDIFFIDDSQENVNAAKEHGWRVFLFEPNIDDGYSSASKIENLLLE